MKTVIPDINLFFWFEVGTIYLPANSSRGYLITFL